MSLHMILVILGGIIGEIFSKVQLVLENLVGKKYRKMS